MSDAQAGPLTSSSPSTTADTTSTPLTNDTDNEECLKLSMALLHALQASRVAEALDLAQSIAQRVGGVTRLPPNHPAAVLLAMKDELLQQEQQANYSEEEEDDDDASEGDDENTSTSSSDSDDDEESESEEEETSVPTHVVSQPAAAKCSTIAPPHAIKDIDSEDDEEDDEVTKAMMADVQAQVKREMQRLAIVRKHR